MVVKGERRAGGLRPCGPLAPRDDKKTSSPLRFDRFVAVLNKHKIGVQERTESAHRSKRTGDFGAACEEEVELQLQAENHRPWRLKSQVWWPVQAGHAGVHIPRSAVQPFRLPGPMAAPTTTSAQECHAAFFILKELILLLHQVRLAWPNQVCKCAYGTYGSTIRPYAPLAATGGARQAQGRAQPHLPTHSRPYS